MNEEDFSFHASLSHLIHTATDREITMQPTDEQEEALPPHIKPRHSAKLDHAMDWRYEKKTLSDHFAYAACKFFRFFADSFFKHRFGHRAVVLETVAAVPGMVGSAFNHFRALRGLKDDSGRIRKLMVEAE